MMDNPMGNDTLIDRTTQRLLQYILDNDLKDGDRLPNERELSILLGVGRSTLRESLRMLVSRNILEVRRGAGTFVSYKNGVADDPLGFSMIADKKKLQQDILEFRIVLEPHMAAWAAYYATLEEVAELEHLCDQAEQKLLANENFMVTNMEFHSCIARCSRNVVLPNLLPLLQEAMDVMLVEFSQPHRDQLIRSYRNILTAIKRRDSTAAYDAMLLHLVYARELMRQSSVKVETVDSSQRKSGNSLY